jgi:hypothetical protein
MDCIVFKNGSVLFFVPPMCNALALIAVAVLILWSEDAAHKFSTSLIVYYQALNCLTNLLSCHTGKAPPIVIDRARYRLCQGNR